MSKCNCSKRTEYLYRRCLFYLRAATENVQKFIEKLRRPFAKELQLDFNVLPDWNEIEEDPIIIAIKDYRESFSHYPRLGRRSAVDEGFIPKYSVLKRARNSWKYVQQLPPDCFENGRVYLQKVRVDLMKILNPLWKEVSMELDKHRTSEAYLRLYRLELKGKILSQQQARRTRSQRSPSLAGPSFPAP
jgi:hypothetical protein